MLLNMDTTKVNNLIHKYIFRNRSITLEDVLAEYIATHGNCDEKFQPINCQEVYSALVRHNIFFRFFYTPYDWGKIIYDFYSDAPRGETANSNVQRCITITENFLEATKHIPATKLYNFFLYLNDCGRMFPTCVDHPSVLYEFHFRKKYIQQPSESFSDYIDMIYQDYLTMNYKQKVTGYIYTFKDSDNHISTDDYDFILTVSLMEVARFKKAIRRCEICGTYFIPAKRSDTIYCSNPCPLEDELTCKQYGARRLSYNKSKSDDVATMSRNLLASKQVLSKRNPDIPEYAQSYAYFRQERIKWQKEYKEGTKTKEEYREWLLHMKSQKVIKEAKNYDFEQNAPTDPVPDEP